MSGKRWSVASIAWALIVLLTIAVIVRVAYLAQEKFKDTVIYQTQVVLLNIAKTAASRIERFILEHSNSLQAIAKETLIQSEISGAQNTFDGQSPCHLEGFFELHSQDLVSVTLLDENGLVLSHYPIEQDGLDRAGENIANSPDVSNVLETHNTYATKQFINKYGERVFSIFEPVFIDGHFSGIIHRVMSIDTISERYLNTVRFGAHGRAWMIDDLATVLSHPINEFVNLSVIDLVRKQHSGEKNFFFEEAFDSHATDYYNNFMEILEKDTGVGSSLDCPRGQDLIAFKKISIANVNWNVIVTVPAAQVGHPAKVHAKGMLGLMVVIFAVFSTGSIVFFKIQRRKGDLEREARHLKEIAESAEAIRESEERFRALVENSPAGILIIKKRGVVYSNPKQEQLFGKIKDSSQLAGAMHVHPDDEEEFKKYCENILAGGVETSEMKLRLFMPDNDRDTSQMRWAHCYARPIQYEGEQAILVNMMDITRAKEFEHMVLTRQKMTSLGHVAAGIAHEIRNPLSGINVYLSTLAKTLGKLRGTDDKTMDRCQEIISQLQSTSQKIELVIQRVMDFSKPSNPRLSPININKAIEAALDLSAVSLKSNGITLKRSLSPDLPACNADGNLIEQVILNLLNNATQAMKAIDGPKRIEVSSSRIKDRVVINVVDSGPGIPVQDRDKIFDPFFTTKSDSTGIGLSICHRIIADHGGTLQVTTSKWNGAEFIIELPTN